MFANMDSAIIIDDDLISSKDLKDFIEQQCLMPRTFMYFGEASGVGDEYNPMFVHYLKDENNIHSNLFFMFAPLISLMMSKHNIKYKSPESIFRQRLFFQPASVRSDDYIHDQNLHVDWLDLSHYVMIYYVNDSDGGTWLYDKTEKNQTDYKLIKFIEHKKGRIILFDGKHYHAGSKPTNSTRIVINTNILKDF